MKIAVATSNDADADHFGKAKGFMIYEFDGDNINFIQKRESPKIEGEKHQWQKSLDVIGDCEVVISSQAGLKGKLGLKDAGIKLVEDEGSIGGVLERYIQHYNFMNKPLF